MTYKKKYINTVIFIGAKMNEKNNNFSFVIRYYVSQIIINDPYTYIYMLLFRNAESNKL